MRVPKSATRLLLVIGIVWLGPFILLVNDVQRSLANSGHLGVARRLLNNQSAATPKGASHDENDDSPRDFHQSNMEPLTGGDRGMVADVTRQLHAYVAPRDVIVNTLDVRFIVNSRGICKVDSPPYLLILILSAARDFQARIAIRNTWGSIARTGRWPNERSAPNVTTALAFLLGTSSKSVDRAIQQESLTHNDIIQGDIHDSYFNLTHKSIMGLTWVQLFCPNARYILKADADVFVHIPNLLRMLTDTVFPPDVCVIGHAHRSAEVMRRGRWAVGYTLYPLPVYPDYTCGNSYVIDGRVIRQMVNVSTYLPYLNIEDVYVTGMLRSAINCTIYNSDKFTHWYDSTPSTCAFDRRSTIISKTRTNPTLLLRIWRSILRNGTSCDKGTAG